MDTDLDAIWRRSAATPLTAPYLMHFLANIR